MKYQRMALALIVIVATFVTVGSASVCTAVPACVPGATSPLAWPIYGYNPGATLGSTCVHDMDIDLAEYFRFLSDNDTLSWVPSTTHGVLADYFGQDCGSDRPHGSVVGVFQSYSAQSLADQWEADSFATWADCIDSLVGFYNAGTVVNSSCGPPPGGWHAPCANAVNNAYDHGILLVTAPPVVPPSDDSVLGAKILTPYMLTEHGDVDQDISVFPENWAIVGMPTWWKAGLAYGHIAEPDGYSFSDTLAALTESGSFTTPLLMGVVTQVAAKVLARESSSYDVSHVLDYVISSCDRPSLTDTTTTFQRCQNQNRASYAPWSSTWGYGIVSAWKALLYTYGFGKVHALDAELSPSTTAPRTVFSDDFELRGDLYVAYGDTLVIDPFTTVSVVTETPEGPSSLGRDVNLQEILVKGALIVRGAVHASVVIADSGSVIVERGGSIVTSGSQRLTVDHGGSLTIRRGAALTIRRDGELSIDGKVSIGGALAVAGAVNFGSSGELRMIDHSHATLSADLEVPSGCSLTMGHGVSLSAASTDSMASGADSSRVEVTVHGHFAAHGTVDAPDTLRAVTSGSEVWVGLKIDSVSGTADTLSYVLASGATAGIKIAGSAPLQMSNCKAHGCYAGVYIDGRSGDQIGAGEYYECDRGVELYSANPSLSEATIRDNTYGLRCTDSSPQVRYCAIYGNDVGVVAADSTAIPDLGTSGDHGNNDFRGPGTGYPGVANATHIAALNPVTDISAIGNWWGTTRTIYITARILVQDLPPAGCGSVLISPILTSPPAKSLSGNGKPDDGAITGDHAGGIMRVLGSVRRGDGIAFMLEMPNPQIVTLAVYDVRGRLVTEMQQGELAAGPHVIEWNGRDANNRLVGSGMYLAAIRAGSTRASMKAVIVR